MKDLPVGSLWYDREREMIYNVWCVAVDVDLPNRAMYAVYNMMPIPSAPLAVFTICHAITGKLGKVCFLDRFPENLFIQWRQGIRSAPIAWAHPLTYWSYRFELVDSQRKH